MIGSLPYSVSAVGKSKAQVICFDDMVLKISSIAEESGDALRMMTWLDGKLPVPKVLYAETVDDSRYVLITRVRGKMACDREYLNDPERLIHLLSQGLQMLWQTELSRCPCDQSLDRRLRQAERLVAAGMCDTEDAEPGTYGRGGFASPEALLQWLKANRPAENLTLSHGDYCLPNIFLDGDAVSGFIDLDRCGAADSYQDIALCLRSLRHNFSGKYGTGICRKVNSNLLFDELGIKPDWDWIRYYTLLDELF